MKYRFLFFILLVCSTHKSSSQAFPLNDIFTQYYAITFLSNDSNNFILDQVQSFNDLTRIVQHECPFSIYNAEHLNDIVPLNVFNPIYGLHNQLPWADTVLQEMNGSFSIDTVVKNWYAYYNKSSVDSTTAFFIIPGTGTHSGWQIASGNPNDYHNIPMPIKDKCLQYGDVYTYVKPNEDFRSIWKDAGATYYMKLDYNYFTPYTDFYGFNWAANMQIECTAAIKCLKLKYNKVIVLGLSNGGIPALIAGLEGGADGINCASGTSAAERYGFPLNNFENPYFYNMFKQYALDSLKLKISNSPAYFLFSFGDNDCCSNAYEYNTHSLQDTFATLNHPCHIDFTYNFSGHHFPIAYLDTFITKVKLDTCASLSPVSFIPPIEDAIRIYPNPAKDILHIQSASDDLKSVQVYALNGTQILFEKYSHPIQETNVQLPSLAPGSYIVNVVTRKKHSANIISINN